MVVVGIGGVVFFRAQVFIKANLYFMHSLLEATPSQVHLFIQHTLGVGDYNNWDLVLHVHI